MSPSGRCILRWRILAVATGSFHGNDRESRKVCGWCTRDSCRIVYLIEEKGGALRRCGFAYGTLPEHAERGEERFTIEWSHDEGPVFYGIYAFSRPGHPLSRIGRPLTRRLQRRFAWDSMRAMARAVA